MNQSIIKPSGEKKPKLLDQVRKAIRTTHYSPRTDSAPHSLIHMDAERGEAYIHWIERYIFFHNKRHPSEMGALEINQFLTHLAVKENVTASTQNQALSAILFLYREVLQRQIGDIGN